MEQEIIWIVKTLVLPPGIIILVALLGLITKSRFLGKLLMFIAVAALYLLSTHFISQKLMEQLESIPPLTEQQIESTDAGIIVVLAGGRRDNAPEYGGETVNQSTLERIRYAARLARKTGLQIIPTGGNQKDSLPPEAVPMRTTLEEDFQVKVAAIEANSRNTRESATLTAQLLRGMGIRKILLVTHAYHMPRAFAAFERAGLEVIAAPTAFEHIKTPIPLIDAWLPKVGALKNSRTALHEYLGSWWYQLRSNY